MASEFAKLLDIDEWLINPYFDTCSEIDFHARTGEACLATENATKAPRWRITLTAPRLSRARNIALHVTGAQKWQLLGEVLAGQDAFRFPIRFAFNQSEVSSHVFWCR